MLASVRNNQSDVFSSVFTVRPDLNCNDVSSYWTQWYMTQINTEAGGSVYHKAGINPGIYQGRSQ